jgi:hypothetical protein
MFLLFFSLSLSSLAAAIFGPIVVEHYEREELRSAVNNFLLGAQFGLRLPPTEYIILSLEFYVKFYDIFILQQGMCVAVTCDNCEYAYSLQECRQ